MSRSHTRRKQGKPKTFTSAVNKYYGGKTANISFPNGSVIKFDLAFKGTDKIRALREPYEVCNIYIDPMIKKSIDSNQLG